MLDFKPKTGADLAILKPPCDFELESRQGRRGGGVTISRLEVKDAVPLWASLIKLKGFKTSLAS